MAKIKKMRKMYWSTMVAGLHQQMLKILICFFGVSFLSQVNCGDHDFRICISTDIEDGLLMECYSEDKSIEKLPRKIMPHDLSYTYTLDKTSPLFYGYFNCGVTNQDGNTLTFKAFESLYTQKLWKFPIHNDMREIRWSVNHVGAWVWMKGRPHPSSIMKWEFVDFWPPLLPPSDQSGPSNWNQVPEPVKLKPRILPHLHIPDFMMKHFTDPMDVLPWYLKGPWK